jgi:hypothetical protein
MSPSTQTEPRALSDLELDAVSGAFSVSAITETIGKVSETVGLVIDAIAFGIQLSRPGCK